VTGDTPVSGSLGLLRESADPTRDVETASRLVTNLAVASRAQQSIHSSRSPQSLLSSCSAAPVAQSNVVAVTCSGNSPKEAQLRRSYRLPILGRIPKEPGSSESPLAPRQISSATGEAYRALRATLAGPRRPRSGEGKVILVTGSSPSEGKTTTAVNIATSL